MFGSLRGKANGQSERPVWLHHLAVAKLLCGVTFIVALGYAHY